MSMYKGAIEQDYDALTTLDFIFARAKLSFDMNAVRLCLRTAAAASCFARAIRCSIRTRRCLSTSPSAMITTRLSSPARTPAARRFRSKNLGSAVAHGSSGLHIPANEQSEIGLFEHVYADIGDEQSIEQSLSTFSAHMKTIVSIMDCCGQGDLVLFDELGAAPTRSRGAAGWLLLLSAMPARWARA